MEFKTSLMLLIFACTGALTAQETGIRFETGSYIQALEKAKSEGKYLFIDCFTTWCVPCKILEKEVFTDKEVSDYFNNHFISYRLDIEKGEGPELKKKFGVQPVPTLVFVNSSGELEHKFIGASTKDEFLKKSSEVFTNENRYGVLQRRFTGGDRSTGFISVYLKELLDQTEYARAKELLYNLLKSEPVEKLCTPEFWPALTHNFMAEYGSGVYDFLIKNGKMLAANIGEKEYKDKMAKIFIKFANIWVFNGKLEIRTSDFDKLRKDISLSAPAQRDEVLYILRIAEARQKKDYDRFVTLMERYHGNISFENAYSLLINSSFMAKEGSPGQCEKFGKMIGRFLNATDNANVRSRLQNMLTELNRMSNTKQK